MKMSPKDYLWLLIPIGVVLLYVLSAVFVPADKYESGVDPRIENCGPGGTWC